MLTHVGGTKQDSGGAALRVRRLVVARQRQGRHVLLQGFLTSAQNMMLLFMQVNLFTSTEIHLAETARREADIYDNTSRSQTRETPVLRPHYLM